MDDVVGWVPGPTERGTLSLIWSCVITIFACTWTVLHLNVPGPNDTPLTIALRKAKWMIINILFPELVVSKAVCDLRLALQELRDFDEELQRTGKIIEWTTHHGSFDTKWTWEIQYPGRWPGLLYDVLGLDRPPKLARGHIPLRRSLSRSSLGSQTTPTDLEGAGFEMEPRHGLAAEGDRRSAAEQPHKEPIHQNSLAEASQKNSHSKDTVEEIQRDDQARDDGRLSDPAGAPDTGHDTNTGPANAPSPGQDLESRTTDIRRRTLNWTITHSYYAQMGGLVFPGMSEGEINTMTASHLTGRFRWHEDTQVTTHPIMHLTLEERDILDKSKADWLLKSLAVLQVTWIIANVIARHVAQLPISQLEIATIAFAVMAILIYLANWWKPKDVSRPTMLQFRGSGEGVGSDRKQCFTRRIWSPVSTIEKANRGVPYHVERVANDSVWLEGNTPLLFYLMAGSSLIFGGLHCLAWDFEFPTFFELFFWRFTSLVAAILPGLFLGIAVFFQTLHLRVWDRSLDRSFARNPVAELSRKLRLVSPDELREHIMRPTFLHWGEEAQNALLRMPSGLRDWEVRPTADAIEHWGTGGTLPELTLQLARAQDLLTMVIGTGSFSDRVEVGSNLLGQATDHCKRMLENPEMQEFWLEYENFLRNKYQQLGPAVDDGRATTYVQQILDVMEEFLTQSMMFKRRAKLLTGNLKFLYRIVIFIYVSYYTNARFFILIILFTSLRAAPASLYQDSAWSRFIPKIS